MKKTNFKKVTLRLTSFVLVLVTVMSVMCVSLVSASAQTTDGVVVADSQVDYVTLIPSENMSLDDIMLLMLIQQTKAAMEQRRAERELKKPMYEQAINELKELGYTKEEIVNLVWDYYSEDVKLFISRFNEVIDELGLDREDVLRFLKESNPEKYEFYMEKYYEYKEIIEK